MHSIKYTENQLMYSIKYVRTQIMLFLKSGTQLECARNWYPLHFHRYNPFPEKITRPYGLRFAYRDYIIFTYRKSDIRNTHIVGPHTSAEPGAIAHGLPSSRAGTEYTHKCPNICAI
jgi:hypothetical protein